jgi:TolB-like protein/DNA-binding winged helix-turn-helix (wHTH) protein
MRMQPRISEEATIRFREFELALKSGELRKNGRLVRLQPQPFKVLAFLASHSGQTVTRQELQQAVWEDETFVDFEHGLNFCIREIRAALGDSASSPRFIETLPRRGYRFIAAVETANGLPSIEANAAAAEIEKPIGDAAAGKPSRSALVLTGLLTLALIVTLVFVWRSQRSVPLKEKVMLAVLPFENLSGDGGQDYFSDGMTEEMIARLGGLKPERLGVIARTSVMTYKGANKDISRIGRELGVDFIVEGSVRREADKVRITAQLIRVSDQTHLWSESYDRDSGGALVVQTDVAAQIAAALAIELLSNGNKGSLDSADAEAVDAYLRGRYLWNKGDRENVARSVEHFQRAIERDVNYAAAYAGLADSYRLLGMYYVMLPSEAYAKARDAALRAIELDATNAEAYISLGTIKFRYEWKWAEAEKDFRRAIEINPSLGLAHHDYGWFLVAMGRFNEGLDEMKLAQRLDPLSPLANSDVGWVYLMARRYDEAIEQMQRTLEIEPRFGSALSCLELTYRLKGDHQKSLEILLKELGDAGAGIETANPRQAVKTIHRMRIAKRLEAARQSRWSSYEMAKLYAATDEPEGAFEWLEKALAERSPLLVNAGVDPALDALRADPRFAKLLRRIGLP